IGMRNQKFCEVERRTSSMDQIRSHPKISLKLTSQDVKFPVKAISNGKLSNLLNVARTPAPKKSLDWGSLEPPQRRSKIFKSFSFQANSEATKGTTISISSCSTPMKGITPSLKPRTPTSKFFPSCNNSKIESQPVSANVSHIGTPVNQRTFSFSLKN